MGDFKVITYKKKRKHSLKSHISHNKSASVSSLEGNILSRENVIPRIKSAIDEIKNSEFFTLFYKDLCQENEDLQNVEIVTYGLGQFSQCVSSRYQFAFILVLKDFCNANLSVYDPVFSAEELEVIKYFDCYPITSNEEGKREVHKKTVFFLPHCPKQLLNNLLWKNWTANLKHCIIVGNSIKNIVESHPNRSLKQNLSYVFHASSFVTEIKINNCFKYSDIFNDLSTHLFLEQHISELDNTISGLNKEPLYEEEDIEFISSGVEISLRI